MEKKIIYLDRLFSLLSIVFFSIVLILLIVNCFINVLFEIFFVSLFGFISFVNQLVFIPGKIRIKDREYVNSKLQKWQFYVAMVILALLLFSVYINFSDVVDLCLHGVLLMIFLILYSIQNILYTFHYDKKNRLHFNRSIVIAIFLDSFLFVYLFYALIRFYRG